MKTKEDNLFLHLIMQWATEALQTMTAAMTTTIIILKYRADASQVLQVQRPRGSCPTVDAGSGRISAGPLCHQSGSNQEAATTHCFSQETFNININYKEILAAKA